MTTMTLAPQSRLFPVQSSARPAVRRPVAPRVRLTRRGRVVVMGSGLLLSLGLALGLAANSMATEQPEALATITVAPGETLWQIAGSVAVDGHTGDMVEQIKGLNHLRGGALQVGQTLRVPATR